MAGRCAYDKASERCVAKRKSHCRQSKICRVWGACTYHPKLNACGPSEALCRRFPACKKGGACGVGFDVRMGHVVCAPVTNAHCGQSAPCKRNGHCSLKAGYPPVCAALTRSDCRRSRTCVKDGACTPNRGRCIRARGKKACRQSQACRVSGQCTLFNGNCVVATEKDCRQSQRCRTNGQCKLWKFGVMRRVCMVSAKGCRQSAGCKIYGLCKFDPTTKQCRR